jgi:hypothetical protein
MLVSSVELTLCRAGDYAELVRLIQNPSIGSEVIGVSPS